MPIIKEEDKDSVFQAASILKSGGIISFATETVYALACDAKNNLAVEKLYEIKGRDYSKPTAIMVKDLSVARTILTFNYIEEKIAKEFMPGAVTLILKKKDDFAISKLLTNEVSEIGLRIPNHKFSLELLSEFNGVIAATSANISSRPPALKTDQIISYFGENVDLIIDGDSHGNLAIEGVSSTVLKVESSNNIKIIREGSVSKKMIDYATFGK